MTHSVQISATATRTASRFFTVEIVDYDNDSYTYDVEARNYHDAEEKAHMMAIADGIEVNIMNIYSF